MEIYGVSSCSSPHQFQHPSLFHDPYQSEFHMNYASEIRFSEEENSYMNDDGHSSRRIMKRLLEEVDAKGHKMVKKLREQGVPIEAVLRETLHDFRSGKHGSDKLGQRRKKEGFTSTDRGLQEEESEHKLERFKVKAVNIIGSGLVKEEGRQCTR